jgi:sugar lactone lactonase YvrE
MSHRTAASALLAALVFAACGSAPPITSCDPIGAATPLCGFQNPEDLALLPDGRVLVSEYGDAGAKPGRISLLDLASGSHESLYAGGGPSEPGPWGAADCAPPSAAFSPHGIHLSTRPSGGLQLLVVQHGGRESVEMFEVLPANGSWQLAWRGCAVAPDGGLNDVVAVPEGGFLVTRFGPSSRVSFMLAAAKATLFGGETGWVYAWTRESGFSEVPGTHAAGPNGIELSADGAKIFLNTTLASEVLRIDRKSGAVEARARVDRPDNLTWASDGRLRVASLRGNMRELLSCNGIERGSCPMPFAIVALDPNTMETQTVYEGGPGTPSGAGTVGLELNDGGLLIGTFAGDRVVRVAAPRR